MGVSDPDQLFLSEKDLTTMDLNFLVRPMLEFHKKNECQIAPLDEDCDDQDHHEEQLHQNQEEEGEEDKEGGKKYKFMVSSLNLKLQTPREFRCGDDDDDDQNDGLRTPTSSSDHKIPVVLQCPPAPRKPRSLPSKRKASCRRVLVLDLSKEIESLFPPNIVGNKIKKVRQESQDTK